MPRDTTAQDSGLATRVIATLRERFAQWGHHPSPAHWKGLEAIARVLADQAEGREAPVFTVSALPVGAGKTTLLIEVIRVLTSVGIAVFSTRLDMIERLLAELPELDHPDPQQRRFAVVTGKLNVDLNQRGRGRYTRKGEWVSQHDDAQVLFSTQAKLLAVVAKGRWHRDYETFWKYRRERGERGEPRQVRVWDESIMPAAPLTTTPAAMRADAAEADAAGFSRFADELRALSADIVREAARGGTTFTMPEADEWPIEVPPDMDDTDTVGNIIWRMAGREVRLWNDPAKTPTGGDGTTIAYRELLPQNLAPMLILDASAHLRRTYKAWDLGRGGVTMLPSPGKTYRGLTIRHWDHPAGKAAYRMDNGIAELAEGCARAATSLPPGERALLVYRKPEAHYRPDLLKAVQARVRAKGGNPALLSGVTWGMHTASNEWRDVRHVIVAGLLQYSQPENEAHFRAAAGLSAAAAVPPAAIDDLRLGEIKHHLFQAVGRGAIRIATPDGDVLPGCTLHVVFSRSGGPQSIPATILPNAFPGATVESWEPFGPREPRANKVAPQRDALIAAIERRVQDAGGGCAEFEIADLIPAGLSPAERRTRFVQVAPLAWGRDNPAAARGARDRRDQGAGEAPSGRGRQDYHCGGLDGAGVGVGPNHTALIPYKRGV